MEPPLPTSNGRRGRWRAHRQVINGIIHRSGTGSRWRQPLGRMDLRGAALCCR
ncbi:transposase [Streptomyces tsukubensis]|nr:transposase [Streptomyces tsukubensis]